MNSGCWHRLNLLCQLVGWHAIGWIGVCGQTISEMLSLMRWLLGTQRKRNGSGSWAAVTWGFELCLASVAGCCIHPAFPITASSSRAHHQSTSRLISSRYARSNTHHDVTDGLVDACLESIRLPGITPVPVRAHQEKRSLCASSNVLALIRTERVIVSQTMSVYARDRLKPLWTAHAKHDFSAARPPRARRFCAPGRQRVIRNRSSMGRCRV